MDIQKVSNSSIFDIYGKAVSEDIEMQKKIVKINLEQKIEQDKLKIAEEALNQFYA